MGKITFPPASFFRADKLRIGRKSGETLADYYARISAPTHDDEDHKFTSSKEMPGICTCGWIHPDLPCSDCPASVHDHAAESAEVLAGSPNGDDDVHFVVVPGGDLAEVLRRLLGRY